RDAGGGAVRRGAFRGACALPARTVCGRTPHDPAGAAPERSVVRSRALEPVRSARVGPPGGGPGNQRGRPPVLAPLRDIAEGTRTRRTSVASRMTLMARPRASIFMTTVGEAVKARKTAVMMSAALEMTRPVVDRPVATERVLSPVRRQVSDMRESRKIS